MFFIGFINTITAQNTTNFDPNFKASISDSKVQDQNFYLFTAIQNSPQLISYLENHEELNNIYKNKKKNISASLNPEKMEAKSLIDAYKFSDNEIKNIASILSKEATSNDALNLLITKNLRPSGKYENFKSLKNPEYISAAWELCAKAINQSLSVYGLGEKGRYHSIDSVSYNIKEKDYKGALFMWSDMLTHKKEAQTQLFFQPALDYTLALLYMNHRDESARYEPLITGENEKTIAAITQINFDDFPYSNILILGNGPENNKDVLTAIGKLNLQLGVIEYQKKNAPIIIVSGGFLPEFKSFFTGYGWSNTRC